MTTGSGAQHARRRAWWARPTTIAGAIMVVLAAGGVAGALVVTTGPSGAQKAAQHVARARAVAAAEAAATARQQSIMVSGLAVSPSPSSTGVALDAPVTVKSTDATITSVTLVPTGGPAVQGVLSGDGSSWAFAGGLVPSTAYTITVALSKGGVSTSKSFSFTTLTPSALVSASVYPTAGMSVGVGQPIVIELGHDVDSTTARTQIENAFTVAMSQPVAGGWYWFSPHELHFRPQSYWPAHEQVRVTGSIADLDLGNGQWGTGSVVDDSFAIGDSRIAYANLQTEKMTVTVNGVTLYTFPISGGRPQYPTMNGDHIVMDRESVVHMVSSTVGIPVNSPNGYDEYVYDDVHISDSGEYVHAAPWSVADQGVENVSHGCINLSPANAQTFFNMSRVGDVVEVTGSPRPPASGDHGVMDWSTPWSDWAPAHVVALNPAGSTATTTTTPAADTTSTTTAAAAVASGPAG